MPGALSAPGVSPPIPNQQQQQPPQQQAAPQAPPAPTHQQTVAALRHFQAILLELNSIAKNPDLGKADVKSAIIDGTTKLVSQRMVSPGQAVTMLATVPERPFEQKTWIANHMQQALQARSMVLAQHAQAFAGQGPEPTPSADSHLQDIQGMMGAHYSGR